MFIILLTKSHYVDQSVTCCLHMNYIENKKKRFVSPRFFHFPKILDRIPIWEWGWGCVHVPSFYWSNKGNIHIFYIFFLQMALSDLNDIRDTLPNHCSTVYLFHFVPVIHVTFIFSFFFQCSIQRLSTFKDRFIYLGISFILKVLRETVPLYSQGRSSLFGGSTSF